MSQSGEQLPAIEEDDVHTAALATMPQSSGIVDSLFAHSKLAGDISLLDHIILYMMTIRIHYQSGPQSVDPVEVYIGL